MLSFTYIGLRLKQLKHFFISISSNKLKNATARQWSICHTDPNFSNVILRYKWWMIQFLKNEWEHPNKSNVLFVFLTLWDLKALLVLTFNLRANLKLKSASLLSFW